MTKPDKRMRVLIINDRYLPDNSGTSLRPARLVQPLVRSGICEIHVAAFMKFLVSGDTDDQVPRYEQLDGVHVHRFSSQLEMVAGLLALHRRYHYDLVHARGIRYALYARMLDRLFRCPLVFELNTMPREGLLRSYLLRYALCSSDRLILLSEYARKWATSYMGISACKIDVVINGVDVTSFHSYDHGDEERAHLRLDNNLVVGYCGTFFEWQGVLELVRIAALVAHYRHDVRFLMVGDGPDFDKTQRLAQQFGVADKFVFTGAVAPHDVPAYMKAMDIFVLPRPIQFLKSQLAVPLKLLEAMAMEKAIVVTPVHGLSEIVVDHETGLVAGPSTESIADAVMELLGDSNLRARLGKAARRMAETKYTWEMASRDLLGSYQRALAQTLKRGSESVIQE